MQRRLKILMVDKYYFIKGGAERYFFELKTILESHGHEVIPFSMQHPENFATEYEQYFVDNIEFHYNSPLGKLAAFPKIAARVVYSQQARKRLERLLDRVRPDIAHLHMIDHQLSPSILDAFKKYGVPVLQTVHQYKLVCPNYKLYNPRTGEICEKCLGGNFVHPVLERCHQDSAAAGALLAVESFAHRALRLYNKIDLFHTPSDFMRQKLIAGGVRPDRIRKLYYTLKLEDYPYHPEFGDYFVYYGRLSKEKGVRTLLQAMKGLRGRELHIVGDGPQRGELEKLAADLALSHVRFMGNLSKDELRPVVQNARFVVVPSEWYDNSPLVIYESFSFGKPVLGASLGGITELVDDGKNGFLFEAGNVEALRTKIARLYDNTELLREMSRNARAKAEQEFHPDFHYKEMMKLYHKILANGTRTGAQPVQAETQAVSITGVAAE